MREKAPEISQSQKILNAAYQCIASKGYANVSLRDIADEAGVVLSQLNYYYKNKEGLFREVIEMAIQKYLHEVEHDLKKGTTAKEKISYLINYFQEMLKKNPEIFKLLYDFTGMALWASSFRSLLCHLYQDLSNLIETHIVRNASVKEKFEKYSSKALARMILGTLLGTALQATLDYEEETVAGSINAIQILFE
ncbi:TetR/AcrR family transcriptional regulator [Candidatus Formimonas warabiya]|uniref:TetR family transcriptional regulator n=1 Tax=Formimonas warabiya TaxID=1761012 RepID=A0A3G1KVH3_FORW1|nr:TetR/AcrR family transcriptional regulator [Candidatus Formimonas warabiya]ATW26441.1 TetR family transcriptional regulator [Candidatus Formimonas warabiya]